VIQLTEAVGVGGSRCATGGRRVAPERAHDNRPDVRSRGSFQPHLVVAWRPASSLGHLRLHRCARRIL
jgi:hypothetical protein